MNNKQKSQVRKMVKTGDVEQARSALRGLAALEDAEARKWLIQLQAKFPQALPATSSKTKQKKGKPPNGKYQATGAGCLVLFFICGLCYFTTTLNNDSEPSASIQAVCVWATEVGVACTPQRIIEQYHEEILTCHLLLGWVNDDNSFWWLDCLEENGVILMDSLAD
jgi:hypothetical protein